MTAQLILRLKHLGAARDARKTEVNWRVITREADGVQGLWSSFRNRYEAVVFACDALRSGVEVLRIEGPDGVAIAAKAIAELCGPMRLNA